MPSKRLRYKLPRYLILLTLVGLSGCLSPIALDRAVIEYDKTATDILSKQLLLNIARAHQHLPLHFTAISNIAATFNFQFNAGATPALTGNSGSLLTPVFGGTLSENPTISIVPIEGEEFTRRLLTPFQEYKLTMLLRQGADIDLVLRLLASELRIYDDNQSQIYINKPSNREGYTRFRQAVLHLSSIQDRQKLFVEPLQFEQHWQLPASSLNAEQMSALQKEYKVNYQPESNHITLTKQITGHVFLTNYDPSTLSNDERIRLNEEAEKGADNDVSVDIRSGHPGGEWPIHGVLRLRSFHNALNFIGSGINDDPEYDVPKHPSTPIVKENPAQTMGLTVNNEDPSSDTISIFLGDNYYALKPATGYQWNKEGFRLLCQIFQMTMTNLGQQNAPSITIAK